MTRCILACLIFFLWPAMSRAGAEFTYLHGALESPDGTGRTFTKQMEYLQHVSGPFAFSFSYLNEGHIDHPEMHHRDGFTFQLWAKKASGGSNTGGISGS